MTIQDRLAELEAIVAEAKGNDHLPNLYRAAGLLSAGKAGEKNALVRRWKIANREARPFASGRAIVKEVTKQVGIIFAQPPRANSQTTEIDTGAIVEEMTKQIAPMLARGRSPTAQTITSSARAKHLSIIALQVLGAAGAPALNGLNEAEQIEALETAFWRAGLKLPGMNEAALAGKHGPRPEMTGLNRTRRAMRQESIDRYCKINKL
jgi:hypothetical protein